MENLELVTFQHYDNKERRLAIFARQTVAQELEMFVLTCGLNDQFNRKTARTVYAGYLAGQYTTNEGQVSIEFNGEFFHPEIFNVPLKYTDRTQHQFQSYCRKNYLKMYKAITFVEIKYLA